MKVAFKVTPEFERQFKRLSKKYPSLCGDINELRNSLTNSPLQGKDLGHHVRKVRMAIASKGKGKSGGSRVLTYNIATTEFGDLEITFLTIYDKGEISNVSDSYIQWLITMVSSAQE